MKKLVEKHYAYTVKKIIPLNSYDDLNFLIITDKNKKYVLKLNPTNDNSKDILLAQGEAWRLLSQKGLQQYLPQLKYTKKQKEVVKVQLGNGQTYFMRLISFIEGVFVAEVSYTKSLLQHLGTMLAKVDKGLLNYQTDALKARVMLWDLNYFLSNEPLIEYIPKGYKQTLVRYFTQMFKLIVAPELPNLRKSTIHGDANEWNIVATSKKVVGFIDWGDLVYSQTINDLAILLAYMAMYTKTPVKAISEVVKAYHKVLPLEEKELSLLYYLIAARLCTSVTHSAYNRVKRPNNPHTSISEKKVWTLLEKWIEINPTFAENEWRKACGFKTKKTKNYTKILQQRDTYFSKAMSLSYRSVNKPIKMEKAALQYMYDDKGNTYLDGVNNICHVGHCHPKVVAAAQKQLAILNTNTRYLYDGLNEYAEALCATFPKKLNKVFFVNSGSAANDLALRLAQNYTKKRPVIVLEHAYHGHTKATIDLSPYKFDGKGGQGTANYVRVAPIPNTYSGQYTKEMPKVGEKYAHEVQLIIDDLQKKGKGLAAFFAESIVGCGGQVVLPKSYLKKVYKMVRAAGGLCVADEVQVGFGRVGSHFWAFEMQGAVPDMVVIGKPMGNGHPMAAVITTTAVATAFNNGMEFFSSFGGNPVTCAIGKAVLEVIQEEQLQRHAKKIGDYLLNNLNKMKKQFPIIGDVRGAGLFLGIELVQDDDRKTPNETAANKVVALLRKKGILLSTDGPYHNVLKFKPPMVFTKNNAKRLLYELKAIFEQITGL